MIAGRGYPREIRYGVVSMSWRLLSDLTSLTIAVSSWARQR